MFTPVETRQGNWFKGDFNPSISVMLEPFTSDLIIGSVGSSCARSLWASCRIYRRKHLKPPRQKNLLNDIVDKGWRKDKR